MSLVAMAVINLIAILYALTHIVKLYKGKGYEPYIATAYVIVATAIMVWWGVFPSTALTTHLIVIYVVGLYRHTDMLDSIKK